MRIHNFGPPPIKGQKYVRRPSVYAILPIRHGILATYQGGIHNEFQLPGGGVEKSETLLQAVHREIMEETGWRIHRPVPYFRFRRHTFMPEYEMWAEKLCTVFVAKPVLCLGNPLEQDHSAQFLDASTASKCLAVDGDRFAVSQFFGLR